MDHAPLVTNETFDEFAKRASELELLVYFQTTRDILAVLDDMQAGTLSDTELRQRLSDFCAERKEFMQRNGYEIIHFDPYAKIRCIKAAQDKTNNTDHLKT